MTLKHAWSTRSVNLLLKKAEVEHQSTFLPLCWLLLLRGDFHLGFLGCLWRRWNFLLSGSFKKHRLQRLGTIPWKNGKEHCKRHTLYRVPRHEGLNTKLKALSICLPDDTNTQITKEEVPVLVSDTFVRFLLCGFHFLLYLWCFFWCNFRYFKRKQFLL